MLPQSTSLLSVLLSIFVFFSLTPNHLMEANKRKFLFFEVLPFSSPNVFQTNENSHFSAVGLTQICVIEKSDISRMRAENAAVNHPHAESPMSKTFASSTFGF